VRAQYPSVPVVSASDDPAARKLEAAGSQLIKFSTRNTCLSQFEHVDGTLTKKPRSQRYHEFLDGMRVGRDLYSGFLARFVQVRVLMMLSEALAATQDAALG
jgi:hypothetical protein